MTIGMGAAACSRAARRKWRPSQLRSLLLTWRSHPYPEDRTCREDILRCIDHRDRVMKTSLRGHFASFVLVAGFCVATAPVFASSGAGNLGRQIQQLENHALASGVQISDIKISQQVGGNRVGIASASCTATATITIPGGTGVELAATAADCATAIKMLEDAISAYIQSFVRERVRCVDAILWPRCLSEGLPVAHRGHLQFHTKWLQLGVKPA